MLLFGRYVVSWVIPKRMSYDEDNMPLRLKSSQLDVRMYALLMN